MIRESLYVTAAESGVGIGDDAAGSLFGGERIIIINYYVVGRFVVGMEIVCNLFTAVVAH